MTTKIKQLFNASLVLTLISLLSSCSENSGLETGGGSGDEQPDSVAVALVTPFVGMYKLPDDWSGNSPDDAFLDIQTPNAQGVAVAVLYDVDELNSCIPTRPLEGEVVKEEVGNQVFLENLLAFSSGILSLEGTTLVIEFQDLSDIDSDNDRNEFLVRRADRVAIMPIDLGPTC